MSRNKIGTYEGRSDSFKLVNLIGKDIVDGSIVPVKITGANTFSLTGEIIKNTK